MIVAMPIVIASRGWNSPGPNSRLLASSVRRVSVLTRVREARLELGSLKPMWPLWPMPRICRSMPPDSRIVAS